MEKDLQQQLADLKHKRELAINRVFLLMFEIMVLLGGPAVLAALFSKKFDDVHITILLLVAALTLSWVVILARYRRVKKHVTQYDQRIADLQHKLSEL